tara:strand:+ start:2504 stop:2743 length:240 start_codon:yes stop_codon:yes gene_type:complete
MTDRKILFITDLIDQRLRKEREIEYYEKELEEITKKLFFLKKEKDLTELIINIIQSEKVIDVRENLYDQIGNDNDSKTD